MWSRRLLYLLALTAALMGQLFDVGYLFHFLFFAAACLPLLGLALSLPAMVRCRVRLVPSARQVERGAEAGWTLRLECRSPLPPARIACRIRVRDRMGGGERVRRLTMGRALRDERSWAGETGHCALLECRVDRLRVCDCLGLFVLPLKAPPPAQVLVVPRPESPGPLRLPEGLGTPRPVPRGKSVSGEDYELRPFREGDSLRTVHWKMTAKRDELVTRELLEDRRPLPVLTLDQFGPRGTLERPGPGPAGGLRPGSAGGGPALPGPLGPPGDRRGAVLRRGRRPGLDRLPHRAPLGPRAPPGGLRAGPPPDRGPGPGPPSHPHHRGGGGP